jgi:hypothetical protein
MLFDLIMLLHNSIVCQSNFKSTIQHINTLTHQRINTRLNHADQLSYQREEEQQHGV